jgi:hypothetical protein
MKDTPNSRHRTWPAGRFAVASLVLVCATGLATEPATSLLGANRSRGSYDMEQTLLLIALYLIAAWVWVWVAWVADRALPTAIFAQQRLGVSTPRPVYRVARRGRRLAAGAATVAAAGPLVGLGNWAAEGLLATGIALLTYLHAGMGKLLQPRVVAAVIGRLESDGPDEPLPAA